MGRYYVHLSNVVDNILKIKLLIHLRFFLSIVGETVVIS